MPKTINIQNALIKEFLITKVEGEVTISLVYALMDSDNTEWNTKRIDIKGKDLTAIQQKKIEDVLTTLIKKVKTIEKI